MLDHLKNDFFIICFLKVKKKINRYLIKKKDEKIVELQEIIKKLEQEIEALTKKTNDNKDLLNNLLLAKNQLENELKEKKAQFENSQNNITELTRKLNLNSEKNISNINFENICYIIYIK